MISNVIKYGGIYAKTCALRSELLKHEDYLRLASSDSVKSFAEALGEKPGYSEAVREALEFGSNRIAIERSLLKSLYRDYGALFAFITDLNERQYLDAIYTKYAVGIIKVLIRRVFDHRDIHNAIPKSENFLRRRLGANAEKLEASESISDLIDSVNGTEFYDVLSRIDKEKATLFDYETQLDFYSFLKLRECQEKYLDKADRQSARHTNGTTVDLHNVMWIYRAKTFYDISSEEIFSCLIPLHYKLSSETVKQLVTAEDSDGFMAVLGKTHYKDVFRDLSVDTLERYAQDYIVRQYEAERKKNPYSLASASSHLYFKNQEIRNLTTLTECVRYNLAPQAALKKIIPIFSEKGIESSDSN